MDDVPILLIVVVGTAVVLLGAIVIAPWRRVRQEPPLPEEVETRLLLGERPSEIAAAEEAAAAAHDRASSPVEGRVPPAAG